MKKGKYEKRSIEMEEVSVPFLFSLALIFISAKFHGLLGRHLKIVDSILADLKANLGVSGK